MSDRTRLVEDIRDRLTEARELALGELAAAQDQLAAARAALERAERSGAQRLGHAEGVRDANRRAADDRYARTTAQVAAAAVEAARAAAPGPAGAPWGALTRASRAGTAPPLRIGEVRPPGAVAVPALVPLLDKGHIVVDTTDDVLTGLLLRALASAPAGGVRLIGYDPGGLGRGLGGLAPLATAGLLTFVGPGGLAGVLDELVDHIRRVNETVLAGEYGSLRDLAAATGRRPEPWRVAVLLGDGDPNQAELTRSELAGLARVLRTGAACGVHVVARGLPVADSPAVCRIASTGGGTATVSRYPALVVHLDPPPPPASVTALCRELAGEAALGPPPAKFADLLPSRFWTCRSADGLVAPVGEGPDGRPVEVSLGDHPPHALIGGPSGSGKTTFIYAWLAALCSRYPPEELELYLLDFKEGVSFARFAPGRRDPSWLPHVRLVGVNVNTDREFGLALLRFLRAELRRRAEAARRAEATKLAELRAEDPTGRWPRVVAVVDEFQVLVAGRDALAAEAVALLEDLARRGRSQGIHLVLASQDVSGIEALWGRSGLVAQFTLRVALPKAKRILAEPNTAAEQIPRYHAVVNPDSGVPSANRIVRVPDAGDRTQWTELQRELYHRRRDDVPPRLFDGDAVPTLETAPDWLGLRPGSGPRSALLAEAVDVTARSARLVLDRAPGRNLAVLGTRVDEACAVLGAAGRSLARQGPARFAVACFDPAAEAAARSLCAVTDGRWCTADEVFTGEADFVFLYAADAVGGKPFREALRQTVHSGPERGVHVLGWWRGVARLREDMGGIGARLDAIGAWVALDVHGGELAPLAAQPGGPAWYPRPWRGLYFDRSVHRTPEVVIPYRVSP